MHDKDDVDILYVPKKEGGKSLAIIEDSVDTSIQCLEDYIKSRGGRLITATRNNTNNTNIITRKRQEKQLLEHFKRQTSEISDENLDMAKEGNLKRETESLLIAAQNNAIRTISKQK